MANKNVKKTETFAEYLARGGKVTKIDPVEHKSTDYVKSITPPAPKLLSLEEADLLYGPQKKQDSKKKKKPQKKIDLNALPPSLRDKFLAKIQEAESGEGFKEESYDDEEVEDQEEDGEEDT